MKILIPNATGPTNIGDQAILEGLLSLINKKYPDAELILHSSDYKLYKKIGLTVKPHLYFWAVFENTGSLVRISRIIQIIIAWINIKFGLEPRITISQELTNLLSDYETSDKIIFIGGGYFRSKVGFTQSLNLLMILSMFAFGKIYKNKSIIAPMSFGPFSKKWQEKLSAYVIRDFKKVLVRGDFSYNLLNNYKLENLSNSHDTALLTDMIGTRMNSEKLRIGFTIRNWRSRKEQIELEENVAEALSKFQKTTNGIIVPIIQVDGYKNTIEDDESATKRVIDLLSRKDAVLSETTTITNLNQGHNLYSSIDILLGMRMHSNIIAAIEGTPFVAISYEYKTEGIAKYLGMSDYCIRQEEVTSEKLLELLLKAHNNESALRERMKNSILDIRNKLASDLSI